MFEKNTIQYSWLGKIKDLLFQRNTSEEADNAINEIPMVENLYLPQIRRIMEQILSQKQSSYGEFFPILIAGEDNWPTLKAARALSPELNRLVILTDNPAYYEEFAETMYEEQGLLVEVFEKSTAVLAGISRQAGRFKVILDFEQPRENEKLYQYEHITSIPIFKKTWERGTNLDIKVPFGYNTVIVSIGKTETTSPYLDRFERAFYENE